MKSTINDLSYNAPGHPQQFPQISLFEAPQLHMFTPVKEQPKPKIAAAEETRPQENKILYTVWSKKGEEIGKFHASNENDLCLKIFIKGIDPLGCRWAYEGQQDESTRIITEAKAKVKALIGNYTFTSPYHASKRLPFNVIGWHQAHGSILVEVETVEYRGNQEQQKTEYLSISTVTHKIESGVLRKTNE